MGKHTKIIIVLYVLATVLFFSWLIYNIQPNLQYQLNYKERKYLKEHGNSITFIGDEGYPPFSYTYNDTYMGYEADLIRYLQDDLGIYVNYAQMNWNEAINLLDSDKNVVITGMKISDERKVKYYFTEPYLVSTQALVTSADKPVATLASLNDMTVAVQENSITYHLAKEYNAENIIVVKDPLQSFGLLLDNKVDAWMENNMTALYYLRLYNQDQFYNITALNETTGYYAMSLARGNEVLGSIINKSIQKLNRNGTMSLLDYKWFGIIGHRPFADKTIWFYGVIIAYIIISCIFILYIWNKTLHYQLAKKTKDLKVANYLLKQERIKMQDLLEGISMSFATAIDYRDKYTGNHSRRVASISLMIAKEMGLSDNQVFETYIGALLHDVGKVGIPDDILKKEGPLTDEEYNIIKKHPEIGGSILGVIKSYEEIRNAVSYHHERYDGRTDGSYCAYPGEFKGEDIPLIARIIAVADSFDAMITDRPYRKALNHATAIATIEAASGRQYDPNVVNSFLQIVDNI